jgi:carbon-monoxide dehydrogenase small subunit
MNDQNLGYEVEVSTTVNGKPVQVSVPARLTLADLLRDRLGLTGTHLGCEQGVCGACSVLVDGRSVRSCLTLAAQVDGSDIVTVEGLEDDPRTTRLRRTMSERHGLQCGFCTAGFLVTGTELLGAHERGPCHAKPLPATEVREAISGNLCRCTGYSAIVDAVVDASKP